MLCKFEKFLTWILENLIMVIFMLAIIYAGYSLYQEVRNSNDQERALQDKYGKEYFSSWHSKDDKEPTKLSNVKGLEDCIYVIMELGRNETRHVIRCGANVQLTVPGKFPQTTATVK